MSSLAVRNDWKPHWKTPRAGPQAHKCSVSIHVQQNETTKKYIAKEKDENLQEQLNEDKINNYLKRIKSNDSKEDLGSQKKSGVMDQEDIRKF